VHQSHSTRAPGGGADASAKTVDVAVYGGSAYSECSSTCSRRWREAPESIASAASHNDLFDLFVLDPGDAARAEMLGAAHSMAPRWPVHWLPVADLTGLGSPTLPRAHLRPSCFEKTCLGSSELPPPAVAIYDMFLLLFSTRASAFVAFSATPRHVIPIHHRSAPWGWVVLDTAHLSLCETASFLSFF
jgi:hypothetical protein